MLISQKLIGRGEFEKSASSAENIKPICLDIFQICDTIQKFLGHYRGVAIGFYVGSSIVVEYIAALINSA